MKIYWWASQRYISVDELLEKLEELRSIEWGDDLDAELDELYKTLKIS